MKIFTTSIINNKHQGDNLITTSEDGTRGLDVSKIDEIIDSLEQKQI